MSVELRPARQADVDALLALWRAAAEPTDRADTRDPVARLVDHDPDADPDAVILAEDDGALVGCVVAGWDGWRCHLYRLVVRPDRRRGGIGAAPLEAAEQRFVALAGRRADAMVLDSNTLGAEAWAAAGYAAQPQWSRWVKPLPVVDGADHASAPAAQ